MTHPRLVHVFAALSALEIAAALITAMFRRDSAKSFEGWFVR